MIRFYTYLFACAYVNVEYLHKNPDLKAFYVFAAWMTVTITAFLNLGALCFSIPAALGLPYLHVTSRANLGVPLVVVLACICWLVLVRNGSGVRLAEQLKMKDEDSIPRCQLVTYGMLLGSVALFCIPALLIPLLNLHPPAAPGH